MDIHIMALLNAGEDSEGKRIGRTVPNMVVPLITCFRMFWDTPFLSQPISKKEVKCKSNGSILRLTFCDIVWYQYPRVFNIGNLWKE